MHPTSVLSVSAGEARRSRNGFDSYCVSDKYRSHSLTECRVLGSECPYRRGDARVER